MRLIGFKSSVIALGVGLICAGASHPNPAWGEVSFKGETINILVGSRAGSGSDRTARIVGQTLSKYLPGNPKIIYRNMPGGSGVKALNHFVKRIKPDGLTIVTSASSQVDPNLLRRKAVRYDPTKFHFLGGLATGGVILLIRKDAVKRLTDKTAKPVVVGAVDGSRPGLRMALWGAEFLNWNIKWVVGYSGTAALLLALERGETDMSATGNLFRLRPVFKSGKVKGMAQLGILTKGKLLRRRSFPNVPLFAGMVKGKVKGPAREAYLAWERVGQVGKWYALPPGTPKEIVRVHRAAFTKTMNDPGFRKTSKTQISEDLEAMSAADVADLVGKLSATPDEARTYTDVLKKKHGLPVDTGKKKMVKAKTSLIEVKRGGRVLKFKVKGKIHTARVSRSRTDVMISGKSVARKKLKAGMKCVISYPGSGKVAASVTCR